MPVNISQATMDLLTARKVQAQQQLADAQNELIADTANRDSKQKMVNDLTAIIADCVVTGP